MEIRGHAKLLRYHKKAEQFEDRSSGLQGQPDCATVHFISSLEQPRQLSHGVHVHGHEP